MADEPTPETSGAFSAVAADPGPESKSAASSQPVAPAASDTKMPETRPDGLPERIDRYTIRGKLGEGAMSIVYEAYDDLLERPVALKVLVGELASDRDALLRINREVESLEKIKHPNVITLYDHGRTPEGLPFLVFELIKGPTLAQIIETRAPANWEMGVAWMLEAAMALDEAWRHHIIHRDLKPGNMIIDQDGRLMIGDFGLAKAVYNVDDQTRGKIMMGTPRYMSPEMATGLSMDFRGDMYSLGATFYHLFVGQAPFEADTMMGVIMKQAHMPVPPPRNIEPTLPHDINDILLRLLEKEPAARYRSYDDLISDLREAKLAIQSGSNKRAENEMAAILGINPYWAKGGTEPRGNIFPDPKGAEDAGGRTPFVPRIDPLTASPIKLGAPDPGVLIAENRATFRARIYMLAGLGLVLIAGGIILQRSYLPEADPTEKKGWIASHLPGLPNDAPRIKAEDIILENKHRMERLMSIIIQYEVKYGQPARSIADLEKSKLAPPEAIKDSWGQEMRYDFSRKILSSDGADGQEKTMDDFILGTDMKFMREPEPALIYEKKSR